MFKLTYTTLTFALILVLAAILRLFSLSKVPPALNWDEAAIAWNAKSIFATRLDEYGTRLPLAFRSFGDYKAPVYIYLSVPIVGLLGANEVSVRLLSVFSGIGSVLVLFLLVRNLFEDKSWRNEVALLTSLIMAITPWHVLLSRQASEANLALFLVLSAIWLFLLGVKRSGFWLLASSALLCLSMYTYHSPKIFVPLFGVSLLAVFRRQLLVKRKLFWILSASLLGVVLLYPLGYSLLFDKGATRFQGTSIFFSKSGEAKRVDTQLLAQLAQNYLVHFSPRFLFGGAQTNPRIQLRQTGPLLLIAAPFLVLGLIVVLKKIKSTESKLLISWLVLGPLPAAVGFEAPHPIRALPLLPAFSILIALGVRETLIILKRERVFGAICLSLLLVNLAIFLREYFVLYPVYAAPDWQYGYKQAALIARQYENQVEKVILTSHYGQPHIFMLVYQNRDPQQVLWGAMIKYLYRDLKWDEDSRLSNVLLIGTPQEIPDKTQGLVGEIKFPDGETAFRIVRTPKSS